MIKRKTGAFRRWRAALTAAWAVAGLLGAASHALGAALTSGCQPGPVFDTSRPSGSVPLLAAFAPLEIHLDKNTPVGQVVYENKLPIIPWTCITSIPRNQPYLGGGGKMASMVALLRQAGLKLVLQINSYPEWTPTGSTDDHLTFSDVTYAPQSPTNPTMTASGKMSGTLKLVMVTPPTKPTRVFIPASPDLVVVGSGVSILNVISIGSDNSTSVALVPKCIAKILTPGSIDLGRAYSVDRMPLPPTVPFTIHAEFDETCDGGFRLVDLGSLTVPLQLRFQPEGNAALTTDAQHILLNNTDGTPNGLALTIKESGVFPITFNAWQNSRHPSLTTSNHPLPLNYSAQLTRSGAPMVPGEFSQKITIQVTFR